MDKLEKALQKARAIREARIGKPEIIPSVSGFEDRAILIRSKTVTINEAHLEHHRILAHRMRSREADIFRILRTRVLNIMNQSGFRTLAITSPNYGDGKTTIALNLALSLAMDMKQTVLLADLDLRKPSTTQYLGIEAEFGLSDYLLKDRPLADCLLRTSFNRLAVLPAGRSLDNSSEVLGSPKMAHLAEELKARYSDRMIIYDMPPLMSQDDALAFLPHVDAVLMVIQNDVTHISDITHSLGALTGTNVIGTVLNHAANPQNASTFRKLFKSWM